MKNFNARTLAIAASFLFFASSLVSCKKESVSDLAASAGQTPTSTTKPATIPSGTDTANTGNPVGTDGNTGGSNIGETANLTLATATTTTTPTTPVYNRTINWNNRSNGSYNLSLASTDFTSPSYWNAYNAQTTSGMLKATLKANTVGPTGGAMSNFNVPDAGTYQLNYSIMFGTDFDFSYGGKVGFGCMIGNGYTGGVPGWNGLGGSARIMWYKENGRVYLKPYAYYKDQPGTYGNDFGKTYPATGSIAKGVWYNVKMLVKANTGSNTNGRLQIIINGTTLIDQPMRWTTNDAYRLVKNICFENFRGGSDAYWGSPTNGSIYFDNVSMTAYSS